MKHRGYLAIIAGVVVVALAVTAWLLFGSGLHGSNTSPYGKETIKLTDADRDALVAAARGFLSNANFQPANISETLKKPYDKDVFVTAFKPETPFIIEHARKGNVLASLEKACAALRESGKFKSGFAGSMGQVRITVHIIDRVSELKTGSISKIAKIVEPGFHGLVMDARGGRFFQLGEEVVWRGWGMRGFNDRDRVMGKKMAELRLQKLAKAAGADKADWKKAKLYYFSVHAMVEETPAGKAVETYRGMMLYPREITRRGLLEAVWLAAKNLERHTNQEGVMGYQYLPNTDEFEDMKHYNIVRHAGAVWGLFIAYQATGDRTLLEAGQRALEYLGKSLTVPPENKNIAFLEYHGRAVLGTNALAAASLAVIPQNLLSDEWKKKREMLGDGLIAFQAEDGSFYYDWPQVMKGGPTPRPQPMYAPGEAFLALMLLYELDQQPKWLNAAKKCAVWQMDWSDQNPAAQPDAWVVQALCKLYRVTKDERIPKTVFHMVEWHFNHQWGMPEKTTELPYEDYFGGADNATPPRSTPTSARNEANVEAWHLARLVGNKEMEDKLARSVAAAMWQNIVDQYRPITSYWVPKPERVIGGIRGSLIANDIRIDYNQHFMTSAVNALEIFEGLYGEGEFGPLSQGRLLDVLKLGITPDEAVRRLAASQSGAAANP